MNINKCRNTHLWVLPFSLQELAKIKTAAKISGLRKPNFYHAAIIKYAETFAEDFSDSTNESQKQEAHS